jgi:hypothetical protein
MNGKKIRAYALSPSFFSSFKRNSGGKLQHFEEK